MDSIFFHHPLFPPFSTTTRHPAAYVPPKPPPISSHNTLNFTCRTLGNGGGADNGSLLGVSGSDAGELFPSPETFTTVDAEITPETVDFFVSDAEGDPDCPSDGFSSVEDALATLRLGKDAIDTSTGVSASDRAKTILALASRDSGPRSFRRPGHVFPLKYRNGGVLRRAGHTEASVDLVKLAGLDPVSVLSTIVNPEDCSIAPLNRLRKLALDHSIPLVLITDLIRYRRKRERLVERIAVSRLPTRWGLFEAHCYQSKLDGTEHIAVVKGDIGNGRDVLVRVHSECLTGDIFGSGRCDCGNQLALAMQIIEEAGRGALIYLRGHEGRGIGLGHKLRAYNLQDQGHDTVEANLELGFAPDAREYGIGAQMLRDIGVQTMRLMTNNPAKFTGLKGYGLAIVGRVPVLTPITDENRRYFETKRTKMGHIYGSDIPDSLVGPIIDKNDTTDV
ncbi:probable monofunctional riboflavin biosynthesis protein RIBA 3, chloroplastic isoform X2 [Cynara cardunculus var. scolymus]|uniref:probable monofunctional riboflavin biosynthesis protein RIBA 3, chloroplastic isoform X2 n=1 Tax=Cynara cardunculus var. scolymus TaxID=59895 RepID=UPI000D6233C7|nr:probable monofunctional riboflavin biosynthesis protein RIBA 3, chloroplastic isoform X2 [Cynara cardunculus var. scolymus]